MLKKMIVLIGAILILTACTSNPNDPFSLDTTAYYVDTPDGGKVLCVVTDPGTYDAGLSCNWEQYNLQYNFQLPTE